MSSNVPQFLSNVMVGPESLVGLSMQVTSIASVNCLLSQHLKWDNGTTIYIYFIFIQESSDIIMNDRIGTTLDDSESVQP